MRTISLITLATIGSVLLSPARMAVAIPPEFLACSAATNSPHSDTSEQNSIVKQTVQSASFLRGDGTTSTAIPFKEIRASLVPISNRDIKQLLYGVVGDDAQAFLGFTPSIIIENSSRPNAFARLPDQVVLTQGLLETVRDRSELSFIVAHELGHLVLGHKGRGDMKGEFAADALAVAFVKAAGLSPCAGADVLMRLTTPQVRAMDSISLRLEKLSSLTATQCVG